MGHNQIRFPQVNEHDVETAMMFSTEAADPDGERRPLLAEQGKDPHLVVLTGPHDPLDPLHLPPWRKWFCASILGAMTFAATFSSSVFSAAARVTAQEFGVAPETMALATSLYVIGFATGPVLMGPASELYGRKTPFFVGYLGFILSQVPVGLASNVETVLLFRFLGGVASSASPAIVGGYLADFFPPIERGVAVAIFAATTLIGPSAGAIIGAVVVQSSLGWRWTAWFSMIMGVVFGAVGLLVLPETYVPVLLKRKARQLRFKTKNWALHSKLEETPVDFRDFVVRYLRRPFLMLCLEPILLLMTLYISFTFGMVYLLFVAYPISFVQQRGFDPVVGALPFIAIIIGIIIGSVSVVYYTLTIMRQKLVQNGQVVPEDRLPPMIVGACLLAVGLFWFAWASSPTMNPWPQIIAGVPIGIGVQVVLLQSLAYLIDIYTTNANSAISGTVIVRSLIGGGFPLFAVPMYQRFGVFWASSFLGIFAVLFVPIPILFYFYGAKIRSFSKYVPQL
ncbi:hypothetical protein EPUS_08851 [Endocarpon pusillum Z07020]|uniref:Major facilitator superfamily (MFS) profile domain-containing protein n=1 Tax=Endocarpon pusillum (strain Z07020 / HMAS-L-300199) TaxID=1263415 RepID=U1HUK0_ENDPU|nr:uncharacterized protein EPUS_08851 [Endocarpon pusillum Z07020]ERF72994.1 hypothetical protein EPUS_08851 [Endocarpon pusillum Z07020]